jgi:hypothetical protein
MKVLKLFRGIKEVLPSKIDPFYQGDGVYGHGTYYAFNFDTSARYAYGESYGIITEYLANVENVLELGPQNVSYTSTSVIPEDENIKKVLGDKKIAYDHLVDLVKKSGYIALSLRGDDVDGGEQFIILNKGAKLKLENFSIISRDKELLFKIEKISDKKLDLITIRDPASSQSDIPSDLYAVKYISTDKISEVDSLLKNYFDKHIGEDDGFMEEVKAKSGDNETMRVFVASFSPEQKKMFDEINDNKLGSRLKGIHLGIVTSSIEEMGMWDPSTKSLYITREHTEDSSVFKVALAHEMAHAAVTIIDKKKEVPPHNEDFDKWFKKIVGWSWRNPKPISPERLAKIGYKPKESIVNEGLTDPLTFKKWFKTIQDDEGLRIVLGMDPHGDDPIDQEEAEQWFNQRKREVDRMLDQATENGKLIVYRCMKVSDDWLKRLQAGEKLPLGYYWTISSDLAPFLCGGTGGRMNEKNVVLKASVSLRDVDVYSLFNPSWTGDTDSEESEIDIKSKEIQLLTVFNSDMKKVLASPNSKFPLYGYLSKKTNQSDNNESIKLSDNVNQVLDELGEAYGMRWNRPTSPQAYTKENSKMMYHCTSREKFEAIKRDGFIYRLGVEDIDNFPNDLAITLDIDIKQDEFGEVEEGEHKKVLDVWKKQGYDKGTIIWLSPSPNTDYGDYCLALEVPKGSIKLFTDQGEGPGYWVPMSPIPFSQFKVIKNPKKFGESESVNETYTKKGVLAVHKKINQKTKNITLKDGTAVTLEFEQTEPKRFWIHAKIGENSIGSIEVMSTISVGWNTVNVVANAYVDDEYQRKGLATAMYNWAEELSGKKLVPYEWFSSEEPMSSAGKAFWKQREKPSHWESKTESLISKMVSLTESIDQITEAKFKSYDLNDFIDSVKELKNLWPQSDESDNEDNNNWLFKHPKPYPKSKWLIHFTNKDPQEIIKNGFDGVGSYSIALTIHYGGGDGDLGFAFDPEDVKKYGVKRLQVKYGKNILKFRAGEAVKVEHITDDELQVIFDVTTVRDLKVVNKIDEELTEIIKKQGSQYNLYSKKGKVLGTFLSKSKALKREKQINYFKSQKESLERLGEELVEIGGEKYNIFHKVNYKGNHMAMQVMVYPRKMSLSVKEPLASGGYKIIGKGQVEEIWSQGDSVLKDVMKEYAGMASKHVKNIHAGLGESNFSSICNDKVNDVTLTQCNNNVKLDKGWSCVWNKKHYLDDAFGHGRALQIPKTEQVRKSLPRKLTISAVKSVPNLIISKDEKNQEVQSFIRKLHLLENKLWTEKHLLPDAFGHGINLQKIKTEQGRRSLRRKLTVSEIKSARILMRLTDESNQDTKSIIFKSNLPDIDKQKFADWMDNPNTHSIEILKINNESLTYEIAEQRYIRNATFICRLKVNKDSTLRIILEGFWCSSDPEFIVLMFKEIFDHSKQSYDLYRESIEEEESGQLAQSTLQLLEAPQDEFVDQVKKVKPKGFKSHFKKNPKDIGVHGVFRPESMDQEHVDYWLNGGEVHEVPLAIENGCIGRKMLKILEAA